MMIAPCPKEVKGIAAVDIRINSTEKVVKYLVHHQESLRTNAVPVFVWNTAV